MPIFNKDSLKYTITKISASAIDVAGNAARATKGGASSIVKKSNNLLEISKLNSSISDESAEIYKLYTEIGKEIYNTYKDAIFINTIIGDLCSTIKGKESSISAMENRILDLKNIVMCTKCNIKLKNDISFCPFCGTALAKSLVPIETTTDGE